MSHEYPVQRTGEEREAVLRRREERDLELSRALALENRQRYVQTCMAMSEIGPRFAQRTFSNFDQEERNAQAFFAARTVAKDPSRGLGLVGAWGTGKTHLAAAIVNNVTAKGVPAIFTTGVGLLEELRASYDRNGSLRESQVDIIARCASVDVLVLDDLGKERFTEHAADRLYSLINRRYENNLPLIVTANLPMNDLRRAWSERGADPTIGPAIIDRIEEMCKTWAVITGPSARRSA